MKIFSLFSFATPLLAYRTANANEAAHLLERVPSFEWIATGNPSISSVCTRMYIHGIRCLCCEEFYPIWIQDGPNNPLPGSGGSLNIVICSGAKDRGVEEFQFYSIDQPKSETNRTFHPSSSISHPTISTLITSGYDINFPEILTNCIIEGFSGPSTADFVQCTCDELRDLLRSSFCEGEDKNMANTCLVCRINSAIKEIIRYNRSVNGSNYQLHSTDHVQLSNDKDPGCDGLAFTRSTNLHIDSKQHETRTKNLRQDFSLIGVMLNTTIRKSASQNSGSDVKYIDIDDLPRLGKFYCEPVIEESDENSPNLRLWYYPYNQNDDLTSPTTGYLNNVVWASINTLIWDVVRYLCQSWISSMKQCVLSI